MLQQKQKWDLEFYRKYIPTLLPQLNKIDLVFEIYVHTLSQFQHRLSTILVDQPPYKFKIELSDKIYRCIQTWIKQMNSNIDKEIVGMVDQVKQLKGVVYKLDSYYKQYQQKTQTMSTKLQKNIQKYQLKKQQLAYLQNYKDKKQYKNKYFINFNNLDLNSIAFQRKYQFLQQNVKEIVIQIQECRALEEIYCLQENNLIKGCLDELDGCVRGIQRINEKKKYRVMDIQLQKHKEYDKQLQKWQQQRRKQLQYNKYYHSKNQSLQQQQNYQPQKKKIIQQQIPQQHTNLVTNPQISQFNSDIFTILEQAESNCEKSSQFCKKEYILPSGKALESAVLAVSRDQEQFQEQVKKNNNRQNKN